MELTKSYTGSQPTWLHKDMTVKSGPYLELKSIPLTPAPTSSLLFPKADRIRIDG